jgi:hypothetical protein
VKVHVVAMTYAFVAEVPIYWCNHCGRHVHKDLLRLGLFASSPEKAINLHLNLSTEVPILFETATLDAILDVQGGGSLAVSDESLIHGIFKSAQRSGAPVAEDRLLKTVRAARNHYMRVFAAKYHSITLSAPDATTRYAMETGKPCDVCAVCHEAGECDAQGKAKNLRSAGFDGNIKLKEWDVAAPVAKGADTQFMPADRCGSPRLPLCSPLGWQQHPEPVAQAPRMLSR